MKTVFTAILLGFSALVMHGAGQTTAASQASPRLADAQFFFTALAKDRSPAVLGEANLIVLVGNALSQVKSVRSAKNDPLLFAVLVDVSKSDAPTADSIREAAFRLFQGLATDTNQGYLVLFDDEVVSTQTPISVSAAKKALDSAKFSGGTAVYDAIEMICRQRLSRSANPAVPRRVILLISDGEDNTSHVTHKQAEQAALEEGVSVFSVVTRGPLGGPQGEKFLKEVSQTTGGFATDKGLKQAVSVLLAAVNAQWLVTLRSTESADGKLHSVQLKCMQKDVHISAPNGVLLKKPTPD